MTNRREPRHPKHLVASKWTCCAPDAERPGGFVHFVVIEASGDQCVLQSILSPDVRVRMPWRDLRDRARWLPSWT